MLCCFHQHSTHNYFNQLNVALLLLLLLAVCLEGYFNSAIFTTILLSDYDREDRYGNSLTHTQITRFLNDFSINPQVSFFSSSSS